MKPALSELATEKAGQIKLVKVNVDEAPRLQQRFGVQSIPTLLLRVLSPLGGLIGPAMGGASNLGEVIRAAAGVTYWATDAKARVELGYAPRDFETGLRTLLR